jgi:hypothetical protein
MFSEKLQSQFLFAKDEGSGDVKKNTLRKKTFFTEAEIVTPRLQELLSTQHIEGELHADVLINKDKNTSIVIFDEARMHVEDLEKNFIYFDEDELKNHPKLFINSKRTECYRPLFHASLSPINTQTVFLGMIETHAEFKGLGIANNFLEQVKDQARKAGYKFICAYHAADVSQYFLQRGAYLLDELKPEKLTEFNGVLDAEVSAEVYTIWFLNDEDVTEYIQDGRAGTTVEQKTPIIETSMVVMELFNRVDTAIYNIAHERINVDQLAAAIATLDEVNMFLPEDEQVQNSLAELRPSEITAKPEQVYSEITDLLKALRYKRARIAAEASEDDMQALLNDWS